MIANIQGGVSMISEWSTVIGFFSLVIVKILGFVAPLDCLGYYKKEREQQLVFDNDMLPLA